ncbi:hypothetical protein J6590_058192 [Homalodisca vitripennis]|nr:hypothetical protein J6590_058192 [Homalodisca vitripennis]
MYGINNVEVLLIIKRVSHYIKRVEQYTPRGRSVGVDTINIDIIPDAACPASGLQAPVSLRTSSGHRYQVTFTGYGTLGCLCFTGQLPEDSSSLVSSLLAAFYPSKEEVIHV